MKIVGLTGGIGSGKSTVAKMFMEQGVAVYISDDEAKRLMVEDELLKKQIIDLLGDESYIEGELNRSYIANKVFNNKTLLDKINAIVHPAVAQHFKNWSKKQKGTYVIKEAAILFENGGYKQCDYNILVTAPQDVRIERVQKRDETTRKKVMDRLKNQWEDEKKIPLADVVITNVILDDTWDQVKKIHRELTL